MRCFGLCIVAASFGALAHAAPLATPSEESFQKICLDRSVAADRIVEACDAALAQAGLTSSQRVELTIARGDGHLWLERYDRATNSYREAIALDGQSTEAWNGLGWALWESAGPSMAYDAFETSVSIDISVQGLGGKAATGRRAGTIPMDDAREMLKAALTIDPDYIWALRELAWSFMDDDQPQEAVRYFEAALDVEPADINARYGLGRVALSLGDGETALAHFSEVLDDAPDDFPSLVYRTITLRSLDRYAQALREADRVIEAFPQMTSGYIERGHALLALGRRGDAIDMYRTADKTLGPENAILYWLADALTSDGQFTEAMQVIERGLALDGADHSDYLLKSYIALELKDYAAARIAAEACLATGRDDPWAHYYIAITLVHDGKVAAGVDRFHQAVSSGLPTDRIGAFASELVQAGKFVEAAELRLKY